MIATYEEEDSSNGVSGAKCIIIQCKWKNVQSEHAKPKLSLIGTLVTILSNLLVISPKIMNMKIFGKLSINNGEVKSIDKWEDKIHHKKVIVQIIKKKTPLILVFW